MNHYGKHFVAIIGGSVAGSEAAYLLAEAGVRVVVFDQKILPYGKIEDGLPKWHSGLRDKEEDLIDSRLSHENVRFIPEFKLGRDATLDELVNDWGFSAVIIAIGAWKDRMIAIDGIDQYVNKGLVKQNDLLAWFNHYHEPGYEGIAYEIPNGAGVVGGGLASLDVVKIIMIELVQRALKDQLGIEEDMFTLEKKGVAAILENHNTSLEALGIVPCTLFYRRNAGDMPLYPRKTESPEGREKARAVSEKLLNNYKNKFLFNFEPLSSPIAVQESDGRLSGMTFQRMKLEDGKLSPIEGDTYEFPTTLIVSSIGSLPMETPSLPLAGGMLKTYGQYGCRVEGYDNVFAIGNVVTGRGNILESKKHGREITENIIDNYLVPMDDPMAQKYDTLFREIEADADRKVGNIVDHISSSKTESDEKVNEILDRTTKLQRRAGFDGDYARWAKERRPVRLEDMLTQS